MQTKSAIAWSKFKCKLDPINYFFISDFLLDIIQFAYIQSFRVDISSRFYASTLAFRTILTFNDTSKRNDTNLGLICSIILISLTFIKSWIKVHMIDNV